MSYVNIAAYKPGGGTVYVEVTRAADGSLRSSDGQVWTPLDPRDPKLDQLS